MRYFTFLISVISAFSILGSSFALASTQYRESNSAAITLGQIGLSFYSVVGGVVQEVLEKQGYEVLIVEGSHADIFPQLGAGKVDILAAAWLPSGHARLYSNVEKSTFKITTLYGNAGFFWAVPSYVPESALASIDDLKKPKVIDRMATQIISMPEATGLTVGGRRVMQAYQLKESGYSLVASSPAHWLQTLKNAYENRQWIVVPLWQPVWVNAAFDMRPLSEPKKAYGEPDVAYLLGHEQLKRKISGKTLASLSNIQLTIEAVTDMDRLVNVEGLSPRDAARRWIVDNQAVFDSWFVK